jgi:hypothetical protein
MEFDATLILIGEDEGSSGRVADDARDATVIPLDQQLYQEGPEPWDRGEHVGEAHGIAITTPSGRAICNLTFEFGDEDSIAMHGVLRVEGNAIGSGTMAVVGGTGKFHQASGSVRVEHRNPKRYRLML